MAVPVLVYMAQHDFGYGVSSFSDVNGASTAYNVGGAAAGDLGLYVVGIYEGPGGSATSVVTPPSGWTLSLFDSGKSTSGGIRLSLRIYTKILTASDLTTTATWTMNAGFNVSTITAAVRNVNPNSPVVSTTSVENILTTTASFGSASSVANSLPLLFAVMADGAGPSGGVYFSATPSGYTKQVDMAPANSNQPDIAGFSGPVFTNTAGTQNPTGTLTDPGTNPYATTGTIVLAQSSTAPSSPTLTAPGNASYTDLAANGGPFTWTYNNSDGSTQQSYAFRRKISGAAAYEYWNVSTGAFQSTEVFNTSGGGSLTFAAGKWTDGNTYQWSVNTTSSASLTGTYANDFTVNASGPPAVSVTSPTGTQVTQTPTVAWTTTVQAGLSESQIAYRVVVESGAFGTTPGSGTSQYDSGVVSSASTSLVTSTLPNATPMRAFVQVTSTGGQVSSWGNVNFTIALDLPAAPTILGSWDVANQRAVVAVTGLDNLLSTNTASIETDATGWAALNSTAVRSTAMALDGSASLLVTAAAVTGNYGAYSTPAVTVVPGQVYSGLVSVRASSGAPAPAAAIEWHDSTNAVISSVTGPRVTTNTTAWQQSAITGTAPANAVTAILTVYSTPAAATTDAFYLDAAAIMPGTTSVWYRGGLAGLGTALVEKSTDNGLTWDPVRAGSVALPTPSQTATVYDYELVPGSSALYRARVQDVQ